MGVRLDPVERERRYRAQQVARKLARRGVKRPRYVKAETPAQRARHAATKRIWLQRTAPARAAKQAARKAAKAAATAEWLRQYPWMRKVPKAERRRCPNCFEIHSDMRCANALGKALGVVTQKKNKAAKAAWVCPPMPMPPQDTK